MELKNLIQNDDRAVSPVIGVILMVAITVILAAVIGTFVLGLGDDIQTEVNAGVTVDQNADTDNITVTWTSQGNADGILVNHDAVADANNTTTVGGQIVLNGTGGALSESDVIPVVGFTGEPTAREKETVIRNIEVESGVGS